jgi:ribosomal protein S13
MKMFNFKEHITEAKNTHMTHIEDMVIDGGVDGTRSAINALRDLRNMLAGHTNDSKHITVKWDGAPAIFAGVDPNDQNFFVAKKGIFNKEPKVYKNHNDIDADSSGDLAAKLHIALESLKKLGIKKGVYQGDIMFTKGDLKKVNIDGEKYITFHPNTIVYAVPYEDAKPLLNADIGVVWHTKYTGSSFENMNASYGVNLSDFKTSKNVWSKSADLESYPNATLTDKETKEITKHISNAGRLFNKIKSSVLKDVSTNKEINLYINTFRNTKVRSQSEITNTKKHVQELVQWIHNRYDKEIDKLKSDKGKARKNAKKIEALAWFNKENTKNLITMFDMQNEIVDAKRKLLTHLNKLNSINTFIKTKDGYDVTGPEGYVAIDKLNNGAVKIVNRMEFSHNNFSKDIIKGWESDARG